MRRAFQLPTLFNQAVRYSIVETPVLQCGGGKKCTSKTEVENPVHIPWQSPHKVWMKNLIHQETCVFWSISFLLPAGRSTRTGWLSNETEQRNRESTDSNLVTWSIPVLWHLWGKLGECIEGCSHLPSIEDSNAQMTGKARTQKTMLPVVRSPCSYSKFNSHPVHHLWECLKDPNMFYSTPWFRSLQVKLQQRGTRAQSGSLKCELVW